MSHEIFPTNKIVKTFNTIIVQPESYQEWIPGYSYFKDDYDAQLTSSGRTFIAAKFNSLGYRGVGNKLITANQLIQGFTYPDYVFDDNPISYFASYHASPYQIIINGMYVTIAAGWTVTLATANLYKNGVLVAINGNDYSNYTVTTVNSYFDTPPGGMIVNVPGYYATVTPDPYAQQVPNIGWNSGGISFMGVYSTCVAKFSVTNTSVGIYTGLCEYDIAIADQRYERIKYAIYTHSGLVSVYVDNVKSTDDFTYTSATVFKITISKTLVSFYIDDSLVYSTSKDDSNIKYVLDCSMYYSNDSIVNASIDEFSALDSYSIILGDYSYTGNIISKDYSLLSGEYIYTGLIQNISSININSSYTGNILSYGLSLIDTNYSYSGQIINYNSRIELESTYTGKMLSKGNSFIALNTFYTGVLEGGGIIPAIPTFIKGYIEYSGFIRDFYRIPNQVFVIT